MNNFYSPLRYPGGKNKLAPFIAKVCLDNSIRDNYIEPYSGGASVALSLLLDGIVENIIINDKDRSIYALWHSILHHNTEFCQRIADCDLSITNWNIQRNIQLNKKHARLLDLGFSTFFLNRTNRSGIINGGVIGGINQNGKYKLDCRFNREELIKRIQAIGSKKKHIKLYSKDAIKLLSLLLNRNLINKNSLLYFDPPYYIKGPSLYMNHYNKEDHILVKNAITSLSLGKWIVSYDSVEEIRILYANYPSIEYTLNHSAYSTKAGKEILFFCHELDVIDLTRNPSKYKFIKSEIDKKIIFKDF